MRASRREASAVSNEAESFYMHVKEKIIIAEKGRGENGSVNQESHVSFLQSGRPFDTGAKILARVCPCFY